ncbi:hypothetical protein Btru_061719 [Bulinus truncatus]|nr:hypothetical protein Btru_061719 [Bulinus truncatus]
MQLVSKEIAMLLSEVSPSHTKRTASHLSRGPGIHAKPNLSVTCASPTPLRPYRRPREYIKHLLRPKLFSGNRVNVVPAVLQDNPQGDAVGGSGDRRGGGFQLSDDKRQVDSGGAPDTTYVTAQHRRHRGRRRRRSVRLGVNPVCDVVCSVLWLMYVMSHVIMGGIYLHQCPAAPFIPYYLVTIGVLQVVRGIWSALDSCLEDGMVRYISDAVWTVADGLLCITELTVFTAGCIITYSVKSLSFDPSDPHYCSPGIYWFTVTSVTVAITVLLTAGVSICLLHCWAACERVFVEGQGHPGPALNI